MDYSAIALVALGVISRGIGSAIGKDIWELVKSPFKSDKEKRLIREFEADPGDAKKQAQMEYVLCEKLENDRSLAEKLEELIEQLKQEQPSVHQVINQNNIFGDNIATISN